MEKQFTIGGAMIKKNGQMCFRKYKIPFIFKSHCFMKHETWQTTEGAFHLCRVFYSKSEMENWIDKATKGEIDENSAPLLYKVIDDRNQIIMEISCPYLHGDFLLKYHRENMIGYVHLYIKDSHSNNDLFDSLFSIFSKNYKNTEIKRYSNDSVSPDFYSWKFPLET